jgi:hypothetical protein
MSDPATWREWIHPVFVRVGGMVSRKGSMEGVGEAVGAEVVHFPPSASAEIVDVVIALPGELAGFPEGIADFQIPRQEPLVLLGSLSALEQVVLPARPRLQVWTVIDIEALSTTSTPQQIGWNRI